GVGEHWVRQWGQGDARLRPVRRRKGRARPRRLLGRREVEQLALRLPPEPLARGRALLRAPALASVLLVPCRLNTELFGLLAVGRLAGSDPFDPEIADLLTGLGEQAAVPVAHVVLYREFWRLARRVT